jgi:rfaE bifunctional protein nucleotidyltransferase chain/domain
MADGAVLSEAIVDGVTAATRFVADGGVGALGDPPHAAPADGPTAGRPSTVQDLITETRARGGTVIATGGCFDLLHAGHVRLLTAARRLGDCLIVCINSDASVTRLKGPGRPVVRQQDRRAVLMGLEAVDAVVPFDEDTPERVLSELRPDIWVKGADYAVADLPEAPLLASWGGQAVVLPYLDGRSTSAIIREAVRHARH